ncbi:MAG: pyridoxine 5'-phosphate synthase [Akkermansia sp.]|nr:pyridoxine 5'-phosphate synthase [Akkermansia sp.]
MIHLGVNIDHVATLRQARYAGMPDSHNAEPSVLDAARAAMLGGADSITLHVREDRRHMQDADAFAVRREIPLPLNLEMGATPAMLEVALRLRPDFVCLVPERRQEITTEGGLDVAGRVEELRPLVQALLQNGSKVSMFIDPVPEQVEASAAIGAPMVELHTGRFANTLGAERCAETRRLVDAAELGHALGLEIHAGHGIQIANLPDLVAVPHLTELNIGHTLIARAVFVGLQQAVHEMKQAIAAFAWK